MGPQAHESFIIGTFALCPHPLPALNNCFYIQRPTTAPNPLAIYTTTMETITNVVNTVSTTATKAIWGEQNETAGNEPVSGVQGKGTATEPYDQGNAGTVPRFAHSSAHVEGLVCARNMS